MNDQYKNIQTKTHTKPEKSYFKAITSITACCYWCHITSIGFNANFYVLRPGPERPFITTFTWQG